MSPSGQRPEFENPYAAPAAPVRRVVPSPADLPTLPLGLGWWLYAWQRGLEFDGRSRRRELWFFILYNVLIAITLMFLARLTSNQGAEVGIISAIFYVMYFGYTLAAFIPNLAVQIRRLHDTGRSGWWWLIVLVPLFGGLILLFFMVQDSEDKDNNWGPSPKFGAG